MTRINIAEPSVKSLLIRVMSKGVQIASGTGFIVESSVGPVLMTNRHVVTGRHQDTGEPLDRNGRTPDVLNIIHNATKGLGVWIERAETLYGENNRKWKEHPILGSKADFVALPITDLKEVQLYPYDPSDTGPKIFYGPAESVSVVGFPFGIQAGGSLAVWATGFVATDPDVNYNNLPIFLIDCRSRPGQSGSAVIAHRSGGAVAMEDGGTRVSGAHITRFLGIYSGRINEQSDLGIVWKAKALQELLSSIV